jgi:hypothetical protein
MESCMTNVPPVFEALLRGVSYRSFDAKEIVKNLTDGEELTLEREPDNAHDSNAIMVLAADETHLGYIAKEVAAELAPWMDKGFEFVTCVSMRYSPDSVALEISPVGDDEPD